ncbi:MAG TPA: hypothetical protein VMV53_09100 [Acidimicrobiales bacterium]|nr:hypothetical protein [Acidimicrobiales bacterium]
MTTRQRIAEVLTKHVDEVRGVAGEHLRDPRGPLSGIEYITGGQVRPGVDEAARLILGILADEGLRLGNALRTPEGQVFAEVVTIAAPGLWGVDLSYLVEVLQRAAAIEHDEDREVALQFLRVSTLIAVLAAASYAWLRATQRGGPALAR